jgi:predicted metal-dependent HD superfamily phosphohydrolase
MAAANENQWREFWKRLEARGDAQPPWLQLHAAYTETSRAYHNLDHIDHCLVEFAIARQLANDPIAVEAAIWFHDVIYDTHRKDNEERSAEFASAALAKAGASESFCRNVSTLILATKHQSKPTSNDASLLTDIDLSILGQARSATPSLKDRFVASMPGSPPKTLQPEDRPSSTAFSGASRSSILPRSFSDTKNRRE